ncbi:hypothetical protein [Leptospira weilii]|uniref:hypothetical protein n=1 Tax=Leptospira weilii TaxID=28184 RepID=UPI00077333F2|nr:hypothetical protein [Leptospira weilii]
MKTNPDYLEVWKQIIDSDEKLPDSLTRHFSYLVDNPAYDPLLQAVMQKASSCKIEEDSLQIFFSNDLLLSASAPSSANDSTTWPESFKRLIDVHEFIEVGDSKNHNIARDLVLGDHGSFLDEYIDNEEFAEAESPLIDDQSDWWIYHPEEKNEHDQPMLYYVSHESGNVKESFPHNVGILFLKRLADQLKIDKSFYPKSEEEGASSLELQKEIALPFAILRTERIGEFRIAAVLRQDAQIFFGILDTSNPDDIKIIGRTDFPSSKDSFNMKVSESKVILFNRMTSLFNPLVWIDISDLTSPKVGGVIDEKGTEAAAIHQDQVIYKANQLIEQNLLTGEKKTFRSLIRAKELMMDENVIVVQNQDEVQVLDRQYNLISQGKVKTSFPKNFLFSKLKLIVCLPDSLEVLGFATKKIQKQKFPSLKDHSCRLPYFVSGNSIWFLTTTRNRDDEIRYHLVRLDMDSKESKATIHVLKEDLDYDEFAIEIVSDEIRIYLRRKILIYRLEAISKTS